MAFELTGTVTDDDGKPVTNADLTVRFPESVEDSKHGRALSDKRSSVNSLSAPRP